MTADTNPRVHPSKTGRENTTCAGKSCLRVSRCGFCLNHGFKSSGNTYRLGPGAPSESPKRVVNPPIRCRTQALLERVRGGMPR